MNEETLNNLFAALLKSLLMVADTAKSLLVELWGVLVPAAIFIGKQLIQKYYRVMGYLMGFAYVMAKEMLEIVFAGFKWVIFGD